MPKPSFLTQVCLSGLTLLLSYSRANPQTFTTPPEIYQQSCAPCHGSRMEGGQAQSLVDAVWQFGSSKSHIFRNIKYGIADFAMPAFEGALTDRQINDVIDYLFETEKASGVTKPLPPETLYTLDYEIKLDILADNLDIPWAIDFLDRKTALITERSGKLLKMVDSKLMPDPIVGTPIVLHDGQGGLLDVAVHPEYEQNGWIYLAYSHALELEGSRTNQRTTAMTRIVRGRIRDHRWMDQEVIYEAPHDLYLETRHHYGCRMVFDRNGYLFFSIGERGMAPHAQDLSRPNGKIHRLHADGTVPVDNPYTGYKDALPSIYCFGNRNPQGLAIHPATDELWESEHGPMGGDELNLIVAGRNYGWPEITYGRNYNGDTVSDYVRRPGMESPQLYWKPSIAVCGIGFVTGDLFPRWRNKLLVGALKYEEIRLLDVQGDHVLHQEIILKNAGRVRDVTCGPDGAVYAALNGPGMIIRLRPTRDTNVESE